MRVVILYLLLGKVSELSIEFRQEDEFKPDFPEPFRKRNYSPK